MKSVIVIQNGAAEAAVKEHLIALSTLTDVEAILIAKSRPAAAGTYKFVPTGISTTNSCMSLALGMASGKVVVFVDARATFKDSALIEMVSSLDQVNGVTYAAVDTSDDMVELDEDSAEGILRTLTNGEPMPVAFVAINSEILPAEFPEGTGSTEVISKLMIHAVGEAETVARTSMNVATSSANVTLDEKARASCLKTLIRSCNIEEIFPHHDWKTHEKESAAASYHTLAALFIRLLDSESALECLRLSDQLEDSPRSLALKGLIALDKGEILGAVANMVSSLQQYEIRKKENEVHYSRFQPSNLEVINDNLNAGLAALNKRDNERALNHFAEAVFNFDPFFNESGVARLKAAP